MFLINRMYIKCFQGAIIQDWLEEYKARDCKMNVKPTENIFVFKFYMFSLQLWISAEKGAIFSKRAMY